MLDLLTDNEFFRLLFKVIPTGIVLIDQNGYVQAINPEGSRMFCAELPDDGAHYRTGDLFRCVNNKGECGAGVACQACILRNNAKAAINGQTVSRQKGKFCVFKDKDIEQFVLQVTASPLVYKQHTMALIIIEDISLVTELSGLIPICSACHSMRNDNGDWVNIAKYLQEHSEAELTHDYCPSCSEQLLNNRAKARG